jgi:hypothetical protein
VKDKNGWFLPVITARWSAPWDQGQEIFTETKVMENSITFWASLDTLDVPEAVNIRDRISKPRCQKTPASDVQDRTPRTLTKDRLKEQGIDGKIRDR